MLLPVLLSHDRGQGISLVLICFITSFFSLESQRKVLKQVSFFWRPALKGFALKRSFVVEITKYYLKFHSIIE